MRSAATARPRPASSSTSTCGPPAAASRTARGLREAACLFGYGLLALWWTWPLALHFDTRIGGGHGPLSIGDNLQFAWNFDHVARAWAQGRSPWIDADLFFPHPAWLALHTMQWHHCALAALAWKVFPGLSLAAVCNSLLIGTVCLNATSVRLLCRHVLRMVGLENGLAAWLIGAGAALGPISAARSFGHWNLLAWGYLPLLMLALLYLDRAVATPKGRRERLRWSAFAALSLALAGFCDVQFVLFAGLWALAWSVFSPHPMRLKRAAWHGVSLGCGVILLSPILLPMLRASRSAAVMAIAPPWSLDVTSLLSPSPWHPILGRFATSDARADGIEWIVAPGLTLLLLGAWGWRRRGRAARPWAWSAIALWVLACGPQLQVAHQEVRAPWASAVSARSAGSEAEPGIRMPFWWLRRAVGPLKSFRVPARLAIAALACWSVCAALGLADACKYLSERDASRARSWPLGVAAMLIAFECWRSPLPSFDARTPRWAQAIRDSGASPGGVVPLPLAFNDWRLSWAMWGQTIHRKPLLAAYLSRAPLDLQLDSIRAGALWRALSTQAQSDDPAERLALRSPLPSPEVAARELEAWRRGGVRFLVWQRGVARAEDEARVRQVLEASGRARLVCQDAGAVLWEIQSARGTLKGAA